jgi:hypothetical protein
VPAPTTVRLPDQLHEQVAHLARVERRSFNGQVTVLVEGGLVASGHVPATGLPEREQAFLDALRSEFDAREVE